MTTYQIPPLPLPMDVETKAILKQCAKSRAAIAELKGVAATIPYVSIFINFRCRESVFPGRFY